MRKSLIVPALYFTLTSAFAKSVPYAELQNAFPTTAYVLYRDINNNQTVEPNEIARTPEGYWVTDNYFKARQQRNFSIGIVPSKKQYRYVLKTEGYQEALYNMLQYSDRQDLEKRLGGPDEWGEASKKFHAWVKQFQHSEKITEEELLRVLRKKPLIVFGEHHLLGLDERLSLLKKMNTSFIAGIEGFYANHEHKLEDYFSRPGIVNSRDLPTPHPSFMPIIGPKLNFLRDNSHKILPIDFGGLDTEDYCKAGRSETDSVSSLAIRNWTMLYQICSALKHGQVLATVGSGHADVIYTELNHKTDMVTVLFDSNCPKPELNLPQKKGIYRLTPNVYLFNTMDTEDYLPAMKAPGFREKLSARATTLPSADRNHNKH
ncbi:hypothetical protein KY330_00465 [Candidatus Woesearchaeota archaeon]|nr:hypothetical protein [Candidatus Woesearchaeota archaeon]